jgi:hypothetical protein
MRDRYSKLVGSNLRYPYLVGIRTESGDLGTGILISARFVLTCGHLLRDSTSAEVISLEGPANARAQKVDDSLDLALLELTRPISGPKAKFTDFPLQPGAILLAVGVQETPGQPEELSVAEIELKYRNKNDAGGKVLDIQLEGGARPGYSGGPVVVKKGGALLCVGVMRSGGPWANTSNAIGLASIRAFAAEFVPDMLEGKSSANRKSVRRLLIFAIVLFGAVGAGVTAGWHYLASNSSKVARGPAIVAPQEPGKARQPVPDQKAPASPPQSPDDRLNHLPRRTYGGPKKVDGNPDVKVWVNTASNVYHCPGTHFYGSTKQGQYMTQAEAQKKANRPAYGRVCK